MLLALCLSSHFQFIQATNLMKALADIVVNTRDTMGARLDMVPTLMKLTMYWRRQAELNKHINKCNVITAMRTMVGD